MTAQEVTPERLALFRKRLADYEDDPNPNPADAVIRDLIAHIDALTARLEAAERERDATRRVLDAGVLHERARADAFELERDDARSEFHHLFEAVTMWQTVDGAPDVSDDEEAEAEGALTEAIDKANETWRAWRRGENPLLARADAAEKKLAALNAWAGEAMATLDDAAVVDLYGYPESGDPRLFTPDPEACTPEEIAAHAAALAAVEAGAEPGDLPPTWTQDGERVVHMHRSPWGVGTYRWTDEDAAERRDRLGAALRAARGES